MAKKKQQAAKEVKEEPSKKEVKKKPRKRIARSPKTSLYAGLYDKDAVRKSLLEAMKETIILLQRYQKVAVMREQRIILEEQMRKLLSGMSSNLSDFKTTLPPLPRVEKPKAQKAKKKSTMKAELQEVDRLLEMQAKNKPVFGGLGHEFDDLGKQLQNIDAKLRELENL
jgi:hypothetical protein